MQMREIPPRERPIDCLSELLKRMGRTNEKDRPGDGSHATPRPPSKSTLICNHVRATVRTAYEGYETTS